MTTNTQTIAAYDQGVDAYNASLNHEISGELKTWFERMLEGQPADTRIFEIGSGPGRDASYLESLGCRVQRSDASQGFVACLQDSGHIAELFNVLTDEFTNSYNVVLANAVFLHFTTDEFVHAAKKVYGALSDSGCFALSLKRGDGEETTTAKLDSPRYFRYWQPKEAEQVLTGIGFSDFKVTISDDWRPGKPQWLFITVRKGQA